MNWIAARFSVLSLLLLAGCASAPPAASVCPVLPAYTMPQQHEVSREMRAAPSDALWPGWIRDYVDLRKGAKIACR